MQIIESRRRAMREALVPAAVNESGMPVEFENDEQSLELRATFGNTRDVIAAFGPQNSITMYRSVAKAVELHMPTLVDLACAYGFDTVVRLVALHLTYALACMGEGDAMDEAEIRIAAETVCLKQQARVLTFASVAAFFVELRLGNFQIYGAITGRKIMEAFTAYCKRQNEEEVRIRVEAERRAAAEEARLHELEAVSWEEYAAAHGIREKSLAAWVMAGAPGAADTAKE